MKKEVWKEVPGTNGRNTASNLGRIKCDTRLLKPIKNDRYGHCSVALRVRGLSQVHRIILETFVGPCPPGLQCAHLDGNPRNNKLSNLKWVTPKENASHKNLHGTDIRGQRHPNAKATNKMVLTARQLRKEGHTCKYISKILGLTPDNVWLIVNKVSWKHI